MAERKKQVKLEKMSFEELMETLEEIVERIETGEIGLEDSLREYEHGVAMIHRGRQILSQVEQRVERLRIESAERDLADSTDEEEAGEEAASTPPDDTPDEEPPI